MNKSTCDAANDTSRLISRLDVGRRVLVNGHFSGTLKYVGKIIGKDGIFCGIELDQPIGKHDGTYRNIAYFECREGHGIFAPTYKVQLEDESNNLDKVSSRQRPSKLTRSAIPALSTHNRKHRKPSETSKLLSYNDASFINNNNGAMTMSGLSDDDPLMNCSMMSTGSSSCMDNSFFSTSTTSSGNSNKFVGYGDDLMMNSNHTYIVTDSDCMLLNDIEINDSNLLIFDESDDDGCPRSNSRDYSARSNPPILPDVATTTSIILERPSVDITLLPVVSSGNNSASGTVTVSEAEDNDVEDDDVSTPMVDGNCRQFPHRTTNNNDVVTTEAITMYDDERSTQMRNSVTFTRLNGRPVILNSETVTFDTTTTVNSTTGNTTELNKLIDQESERLMDAMNHNKRENAVCVNKVILDEDGLNGNNNDQNDKMAKSAATKSPPSKHSDSSTTRNRKSETTEKSTTTKPRTGKKLDTPITKKPATVKHSDKARATSPIDTANKPERPPKKPRMSIREMLQQSAPPPATTRPPKAPSKNQLMMERMKASIEAEKLKAKKEVKSKLSEILHSDNINTNSIVKEKSAQSENAENEEVVKEDHTIDEQENMTISGGVAVKSTAAKSHTSTSNVAQHQSLNRLPRATGVSGSEVKLQNKTKAPANGGSTGVLSPTSKSATMTKNDGKDATLASVKRPPLKARQNIPSPSSISSATNNHSQSGAPQQRGMLSQHHPIVASSSLKQNSAIKRTIPPSSHFVNNNSTTSHISRYARPTSTSGIGCGGGGVDRRGPSIDAKKRCPPTSVTASTSSVASSAKDASVKLATTFKPSTTLSNKAASAIEAKKKVIETLRREADGLRSQLCWNAKAVDVLAIVHRWMGGRGEDTERRHVDELEQVRAEHAAVTNSIKQRCELVEAERESLVKRCDELEARCAEEKARCEALEQINANIAAERVEFEAAMAKNEDEKTKKLLGDLNSMKFDVEQKSVMLRELRSQNHHLQFIVDTIPGKDTELQKLTHRCDELSTELTHQHLLQKQLVQQLEECRREARCATQHAVNVEKENDILRYELEQMREQQQQYAALASPHSSWNKSLNCTSTPLSSRVNGRNTCGSAERPLTGDRPHSTSAYTNPNLFQTPPRGVMCKSLDSSAVERSLLSIYQEQGRQNRHLNTPSKIYTPNGTFEVNESKLSSESNNNATADKVSSSDDANSSSCLDTGNDGAPTLNVTRRIDFDVSEDDISQLAEPPIPSIKEAEAVEEVF